MMHARRRLVVAILTLAASFTASPPLVAQQAARSSLPMPPTWSQGYARPVSGEVLVYPWAYPGQVEALLSRATDGRMAVEWEGEALPAGPGDGIVTYLWHAGTASGYGAHRFILFVNDRLCATFTSGQTTADREWSVRGEGAATLWFKTTRVGTFNELFGFMWLTAPRSLFGTGAPRFRVVGEAADSQDYYLGPKEPVRSWVRVRPEEAVLAGGHRAVRLEISRVGDAAAVALKTGTQTLWGGTANPGFTSALVPAGPNQKTRLPLVVEIDGRTALEDMLELTPVRRREVHLLPHSHVDIGYSDPQPAVERKQWKNLRDAVELVRKTASYPPEARFKWNVEGLWSVESYLKQASLEDRDAFVAAVKQGSIGLQANYTNILTGLATPEELRHWTDAARQLRTAYGFPPIRSAMHSDIPGLSWTVVSGLAEAGVRYFSSGPNYVPGLPDRGDRIGATIKALGDRPFWWASPSGEQRLLFWMAGRGYSWFHGLNTGQMSDNSRDTVLDYVRELSSAGYPWDLIQARYTIGGDNGPTDPSLPDIVKRWNEQFETPRLVINTAEAMCAELEKRHGAALPVMSGDMTPYWEDGAISTAAEEALTRASARRLAQAQTLWALRNPAAFPVDQIAEAWRNVLLWHEHTWGAADSVSQPDRQDVVEQWEYKRAFAVRADQLSRAALDGASPRTGDSVDVINTLAWARSGLVIIPADQSRAGDRVVTAANRALPSQRLLDGRLAVWIKDIPPLGSVRLRVEPGGPAQSDQTIKMGESSLDNGRVRIEIDRGTGAIARLFWRPATAGRSVVLGSPGSAGAPGVAGRGSTPTAVGFTWRPGGETGKDVLIGTGLFNYLYVPGRDPSQAQGVGGVNVRVDDRGPLVATVRVETDAAGATKLIRVVQLVAGSDTVFVSAALDKRRVRTKESAHLALPLSIPDGVVRLDEGEAVVEAERNQLAGSCRDFVGVHSAVDVSGRDYGVSVATLDAPLIELGAMTDERQNAARVRSWPEKVVPGTTLYAYLLNNYWHTNYKADQEGPLRFRFALQPHGAFDVVALRRFSDEQDQPLLVVPAVAAALPVKAPFTVAGGRVIAALVAPVDAGKALLIRLYNPTASETEASIRPATSGARLFAADSQGTAERPIGSMVKLPPYATRMVRLDLR
jgi:hypothetical protein